MKSVSRRRAVPVGLESARRLESLAFTSIALLVFLITFSSSAFANCSCQCVNGELAAICTGNVNVQPTCAPRACPPAPASVSMAIQPVSSQGAGGSTCAPVQVLNPVSRQYELKVLCR